ncbi:MAG: hypothetical protein AUJ57_11060 [Zetaproteobacteria bacterium CG1_02_53_45]|nr:MAG: hypothetical protein AUJ57_11060 [Zetaproteobacteria bacterium CG1_02_53_45]
MILKNQKILSLELSMDDVEGAIGRDFRGKKQDCYEIQDLKLDAVVCAEKLLQQLHKDATPRKEILFSAPKQRKPIARSTQPIARKPVARSQKPIARSPIVRKPVEFTPNQPFVQPERKPYKKPKPGRNDFIDDHYSAWLGTQPCIITGQVAERGIGPYNTHCHHVRGWARGRRNDHAQVPLAGHLHTYANHSYHVLGKSGFLEKWKEHISDDVEDIVEYFDARAKAFKEQYDAEMKGVELIAE